MSCYLKSELSGLDGLGGLGGSSGSSGLFQTALQQLSNSEKVIDNSELGI